MMSHACYDAMMSHACFSLPELVLFLLLYMSLFLLLAATSVLKISILNLNHMYTLQLQLVYE